MELLGIDIGGSGVKGALVDSAKGVMVSDRHRIPTPQPATPDAVAGVVAKIVRNFEWDGPIGCTFPSVVRRGVVETAANVDKSWIGVNGAELFSKATGCPVTLLNDADAAGIAEVRLGAGQGRGGTLIMLTFGTGIGSAIFNDGVLLPNTELGHIEFRGMEAEHYAAGRLHEESGMSYAEWGDRVNEVLRYLAALLSPDLFIVGGGISKNFDRFEDRFDVDVEVVPASMRNRAGIIGAALAAVS